MSTNAPLPGQLVPAGEIGQRVLRLQRRLEEKSLDGALILDPLNMYYYTGTMQQGLVFVPTAGEPVFLVRRSYERARLESPLSRVLPLKGFSQLPGTLADLGLAATALGLAEAQLSVALFRTLAKAFPQAAFTDIGDILSMIRAVKSDYEVGLIRTAGLLHRQVYDAIPAMLRQGMSEWELGAEIQRQVMALGYTGITRFVASGAELFLGIVSFGESGNYPTASVGPGGQMGLSPAFPLVGGRRRLGRGEPIFIDVGFGYEGYFTDKTRIFSLGTPPAEALAAHRLCLEIQEAARSRLKPGAVPSQMYREIMDEFVHGRGFAEHFMGFGGNQVPFLGHGIGLAIDEFPAIAGKIHTPLEANMVIALEPKKGLVGIGLVGVENTFLVTDTGGEKLTPGVDELIVV
ncbi:MAG: Xaa-Pro peptidase family protein [Desulfobulbus sp.]|jgi:Xaa-Pro aminopeptidase|uniref:M24 family metallopeptidase n=1 Tax=Desulfobulbus sp. TaxID=895 RepID=UPI002846F863|nr:Xaa-Pro peptidase family protein [Desulfobulbus sp.]MDR2550935.1 Xaa-Pro peptidase family protein [Desulfobulbus sp.]